MLRVTTASDNNGGTLVSWDVAPPAPRTQQNWTTGASGDWSDAADWQSGAVPDPGMRWSSRVLLVVLPSMELLVVRPSMGTADAYSLALDDILTVSGTLNLSTSLTMQNSWVWLNGGTLSAELILRLSL